jgi:hypothetical protein
MDEVELKGIGPQGSKGDPGTNGADGATNVVVGSAYLSGGTGQVGCAAGEKATGGGLTGESTLDIANAGEPAPNNGTPTAPAGTCPFGPSSTKSYPRPSSRPIGCIVRRVRPQCVARRVR